MPFFRPVPTARPPAIDDQLLQQLRKVAYDAPQSLATEAEAEWLLSCAGPLLDELIARRAAMDSAGQALCLANVIPLPGSAA